MSTDPFELRRELPDDELMAQGERLVGFAHRYARLEGQMRLLIEVDGVRAWAGRHHQTGSGLIAALGDRYPLVIFHGDVGTGKTASAEATADRLARLLDVEGYLLKLSTRVRGIGHVGELGTLVSEAFDEALRIAGKSRFVTLLVDEGDALAFNRGAERAHHEDRVGVNTIIQKIDDARALGGRLLIILSTNRFTALDPAVVRRASLVELFERPTADERRELFGMTLAGVPISPPDLDALVVATGERGGGLPFTFSDIQTRLIPAALARAYPDRALSSEDLLRAAAELEPSPSMEAEA
jgi:AAA+ superfamily predicted ATPase